MEDIELKVVIYLIPLILLLLSFMGKPCSYFEERLEIKIGCEKK